MSCADVCISGDHDEAPSFYAQATVTARKAHECCECHEPINPGESYERYSGRWDGRMDRFTTCRVCVEVRDVFACNGFLFGMLWESVRDELFPVWREHGPWDCLAKLTTPEAVTVCTREFAEWEGENA